MTRIVFLFSALMFFMLNQLHGDEAKQPAAAVEPDARLHADGKGWRLDKAKIVDAERPTKCLLSAVDHRGHDQTPQLDRFGAAVH